MVVRKRPSTSAISLSFATLIILLALPVSGPAFGQGAGQRSPMSSQAALPGPSDGLLAKLEGVYKDIHANPELSMQERRTAGIAAKWLREQGYEVTEGVGGTGVVGLMRNGEGATVLLRADMDALPMSENTGLPYASTTTGTDPSSGRKTGIAHSCGHDMHVTWLMGGTQILAANRDKWRGTVMAVFQPGEETGEGARAMVEDGLTKRFPKPTVALAQHVLPFPADEALIRSGLMLSQSDSLRVTLFGRGGHGSSPQTTIDPVVMAAAVMRLQTVVSRKIAMTDNAAVSVGSLQAGSSANIIPNEAVLQLNIRTFNDQVREQVLSSIRRIVNGEATTSGAPKPPTITTLGGEFPLTVNDEDATRKVAEALRQRLGAERVGPIGPASASEDFSVIPRAWGDVPSGLLDCRRRRPAKIC
jgi:amidohydrolase